MIAPRKIVLVLAAALLPPPCALPSLPADVVPYPRAPGDRPNADVLSVTVNGASVDTVATVMNVGYAHFAFSGEVTVRVVAKETIKTFDLTRNSHGDAEMHENEIRSRLHLFAAR